MGRWGGRPPFSAVVELMRNDVGGGDRESQDAKGVGSAILRLDEFGPLLYSDVVQVSRSPMY